MKKEMFKKENEYAYTEYFGQKVSKDDRAKSLMGYRNEGHPGGNALFGPMELGYICPVCGDGKFDESLHWSEYDGFVWCQKCNLDIPSCLCVKYSGKLEKLTPRNRTDRAIKIFLDTVESCLKRQSPPKEAPDFNHGVDVTR